MLTEDQIEAMARANWPGIEWDDESLAESAHLREAFRAGVRAVIAANEAKAAPAVSQGELASVTEIETVIDWCVSSYMPMPSNEHAALLVDRLRHLRANPAAPSQPVTLTEEEICECFGIDGADDWVFKGSRAIIAALREKEQAT